MKKKIAYLAFVVLVVAVSAAHARRGQASPFTFAVHPLQGYAGQVQ